MLKSPARYRWYDRAFRLTGLAAMMLGIVVLFTLLIDVSIDGLARISFDFFTSLPSRKAAEAGIYSAWVGTVWVIVPTAIMSFILGVSAAIYLEEYHPDSRFSSFLEILITNLAGVPSILYGLLGLEIFARMMGFGQSVLTGSLTLTLLIIPMIISATREALRAVPFTLREASYAMGASRWQTIWYQVLPAAAGGIMTGMILGISRAIGETAPLIAIGALTYVPFLPQSIFDPFTVLPLQIFNWVSRPQAAFAVNAAAGILVLLAITILLNGVAIYWRNRWEKRLSS